MSSERLPEKLSLITILLGRMYCIVSPLSGSRIFMVSSAAAFTRCVTLLMQWRGFPFQSDADKVVTSYMCHVLKQLYKNTDLFLRFDMLS